MNRKDLTILLSAILLVCFFIPNVEWDSFEMSGFNFVISSNTPDTKYILLLGPFSALFLLAGAFNNKDYAFSRNLMRLIPFFTMIILFVICYREAPGDFSLRDVDLGCWIALIASLLLFFVKPKAQVT
jgi:hypothetical protein